MSPTHHCPQSGLAQIIPVQTPKARKINEPSDAAMEQSFANRKSDVFPFIMHKMSQTTINGQTHIDMAQRGR
jgi:hypothetical protein